MSYSDLLERMQGSDTEAFLEMTERYGWAVYSSIRQKYSDQAVADRIYDETMHSFYHHLSQSDADDPLEALLCAFADKVSSAGSFPDVMTQHHEASPHIHLRPQEQTVLSSRKSAGKWRFWLIVAVLLIWIVLLGLVWLTAGVMMAMDYIPFYDFGYSWFDANIFDFF